MSDRFEKAAALLKAVGHPVRLRVLWELDSSGPLAAGTLADRLGVEPSALSHHLRGMRELRLVEVQREGRHRLYAVHDHHVAHIVRDAVLHVEEDGAS